MDNILNTADYIPTSDLLLILGEDGGPYLEEGSTIDALLDYLRDQKLGLKFLEKDWGCKHPLLITKLYLDTYHNINPTNIHRFSTFSSEYDGFMKEADKLVKIAKNSRYFDRKVYEGKDEFYHEFMEKFMVFYEALISLYSPLQEFDEDIYECVKKIPRVLEELIEKGEANFTVLLKALLIILKEIRDKTNPGVSVFPENEYLHEQFGCNETAEDLSDILKYHDNFFEPTFYNSEDEESYYNDFRMETPKTPELILTPFMTPRGIYGINTFLYSYFNNLFLVGISLNPYKVHFGGYDSRPFDTSAHDIAHNKEGGFSANCSQYSIYYSMYNHIMVNHNIIGEDKAKMLIYTLFVEIHEVYPDVGIYDMLTVVLSNIPDSWIFFERNSYYTPERYNIDLDFSIIDTTKFQFIDAYSPNIYPNKHLNGLIQKYLTRAITEINNDFNEIKMFLNNKLSKI